MKLKITRGEADVFPAHILSQPPAELLAHHWSQEISDSLPVSGGGITAWAPALTSP